MQDTEVTWQEYQRFLRSPDHHPAGEELTKAMQGTGPLNHPAYLDLMSIILYCNWLSRVEGRTPCYRLSAAGVLETVFDSRANGYRLPSGAEWENAYRDGTITRLVTGDDVNRLMEYGNLFGPNTGGPVRSALPNPLGLFDLAGNQWELCWDSYNRFATGVVIDAFSAKPRCHMRGGSASAGLFYLDASFCMPRAPQDPIGFRVVCGPEDSSDERSELAAAAAVVSRTLERRPDSSRARLLRDSLLRMIPGNVARLFRAANDASRARIPPPGKTLNGKTNDPLLERHQRFQADLLRRARVDRVASIASILLQRNKYGIRQHAEYYDLICTACMLILDGDFMEYRRLCRELLGRSYNHDNLAPLLLKLRPCVLAPECLDDFAPWIHELEKDKSGATSADKSWLVCTLYVLGAAHYRAGHFERAVQCCRESIDIDPTWRGSMLNWPVLSMAYHRLGNVSESTTWLLRSEQWIREVLSRPDVSAKSGLVLEVENWLEMKVLTREARALAMSEATLPVDPFAP
jgi:hypothetical protein